MKGERPLFPKEQLVSAKTRQMWYDRTEFLMDHLVDDRIALTEWEMTFIQDIEKRLSEEKDLTLSQSSKLNEIFHRIEEAVG
jgi:hypothetical protein